MASAAAIQFLLTLNNVLPLLAHSPVHKLSVHLLVGQMETLIVRPIPQAQMALSTLASPGSLSSAVVAVVEH